MEIISAILSFQNIIYTAKFLCKVLEYLMNNNSFTVITSLVPRVWWTSGCFPDRLQAIAMIVKHNHHIYYLTGQSYLKTS